MTIRYQPRIIVTLLRVAGRRWMVSIERDDAVWNHDYRIAISVNYQYNKDITRKLSKCELFLRDLRDQR